MEYLDSPQIRWLLEHIFDVLKSAVWPIFWLLLVFIFLRELRSILIALYSLVDRARRLKVPGVELEIFPPEAPESILATVQELTKPDPTTPKGIHLLRPEEVGTVRAKIADDQEMDDFE